MLTPFEIISLRRQIIDRQFARMNPPQRQAVYHTDGPLLILAGAGSGKTTVLVNRIANLVRFGSGYISEDVPILSDAQEEKLRLCAEGRLPLDGELVSLLAVDPCPAWRMLAITFTNKAAGELKDRLAARLGPQANDIWASTFHSACVRILRRDIDRVGFDKDFTIYDTDDVKKCVSSAMKELSIDEKALPIKSVINAISKAKDKLMTPDMFLSQVGHDYRLGQIGKIYERYQDKLMLANAMDFDDIIMNTVRLFNCAAVDQLLQGHAVPGDEAELEKCFL